MTGNVRCAKSYHQNDVFGKRERLRYLNFMDWTVYNGNIWIENLMARENASCVKVIFKIYEGCSTSEYRHDQLRNI